MGDVSRLAGITQGLCASPCGEGRAGGDTGLYLHGCRAARWRHALGALQEAAHLLCTIARGRLVLPQTLLKGLEGLRAGLADLTDDGAAGRAPPVSRLLQRCPPALPSLRALHCCPRHCPSRTASRTPCPPALSRTHWEDVH